MDYYTIYILSGLIVTCYVYIISIIIRDLHRFDKVCLIIALLLISQVSEMIYGQFNYSNFTTHTTYDVFIWIGLRNAAFGLAHWLYAVEFWFSSLKLKTIVEDE